MLYKVYLSTPELDIKCVEGMLVVKHSDSIQKLVTQGADIILVIKMKVDSYRVNHTSRPHTTEITVTGKDPRIEIRLVG